MVRMMRDFSFLASTLFAGAATLSMGFGSSNNTSGAEGFVGINGLGGVTMGAGGIMGSGVLGGWFARRLSAQENGTDKAGSGHHVAIKSFDVSEDETLTYPSNLANIPDEHTTIMPIGDHERSSWAANRDSDPVTYLIFASSALKGGNGGAVVLETTDLTNFTFATDRGYAEQVMNPPVDFHACDVNWSTVFDENYSAPGSVLQDPTRPPGNFIMLYEAENHCPTLTNQQPYYATVGFARSPDFGRTWPQPVDDEFGGPDRHPVLKSDTPEPTVNTTRALGNAIPSAFVDGNYVYVVYGHAAGAATDGLVRVARAKFDGNDRATRRDHDRPGGGPNHPLEFFKWNGSAFDQPGIGGSDVGPVPAGGCPGRQGSGEISYNDDLGRYFMIFVCNSFKEDGYGSWYYSTATSLELQDWAQPVMIGGSRKPIIGPCNLKDNTGNEFDGFYPSFMSPDARQGHTRLTGKVFFLKGCDTGGDRLFLSRTFTITIEP